MHQTCKVLGIFMWFISKLGKNYKQNVYFLLMEILQICKLARTENTTKQIKGWKPLGVDRFLF